MLYFAILGNYQPYKALIFNCQVILALSFWEKTTKGKSGRISTKLGDQANYVKKAVYAPIWTKHGVLFNYNPTKHWHQVLGWDLR